MLRTILWATALIAAAAITLLSLSNTVAAPLNEECRGTIGAQSFENLIVPDGANCTLNATRVDGNILVGTAATLTANGVIVGGNIQAEGSTNVTVQGNARVGGSVQIKQGGGATVQSVNVTGDIQLESNSDFLRVERNVVGGNIQITQNSGGAQVIDNRIDGNLQCKENAPPFSGSGNQAASLEDQCAPFGGASSQPTPTATPSSTPGNTPSPLPSPSPTATPGSTATPTRPDNSDGQCRGVISGGRFENLEVPAGASCTLNGTFVDGNITVGVNAVLLATEVIVEGNIQADGATDVTVHKNSRVGGNIQVKQGASATVDGVVVIGDIQYESNNGALNATDNQVGGNIQIFQNRGWISVTDNRIDGNLQCKENSPPPTGGRNQAASFEDQCVGFAGEPQVPSPAPGGNSVNCQGFIGSQTYQNIVVPDGASCNLVGTRATGNVTVGSGATLKASRLTVDGHVQAQGATVVTLHDGSSVGGNVHIAAGDSATIDGVQISGNLTFDANRRTLAATSNQVGGDLQATGNAAGLVVRSNTITGALQCSNNSAPPIADGNQVTSRTEQCAAVSVRLFVPVVSR